jgi:peptide/nickel transport system ATP-binding protein
MAADQSLLAIQNLKTFFYTSAGTIKAVDGVGFQLDPRETLGVVGESGSGKSVTALSILRLIPQPPGKILEGEIRFEGVDLLSLPENRMRHIRGNRISMIFQEPMTSLNPVFTVGDQIAEAIVLHQGLRRKAALEKTVEMLRRVGIPSPEKRVHDYPYQLSGGMRQRVMISMALSCHPMILIADEPTTALDVTIQAQILDLMNQLKEEMGTAILLITHNLGVVAEMADKVVVMYSGKVMESAEVEGIFYRPCHPYTRGLLETLPRIDDEIRPGKRLPEIPGMVPNLSDLPVGCAFHPRCKYAMDVCRKEEPELRRVAEGHYCRCWLES